MVWDRRGVGRVSSVGLGGRSLVGREGEGQEQPALGGRPGPELSEEAQQRWESEGAVWDHRPFPTKPTGGQSHQLFCC